MQSKEAVVEKVGDHKYQHPSMRYAGRGTGWDEREGRDRKKTTKQEKRGGEKKTPSTPGSTPQSQEDNIGANPAH